MFSAFTPPDFAIFALLVGICVAAAHFFRARLTNHSAQQRVSPAHSFGTGAVALAPLVLLLNLGPANIGTLVADQIEHGPRAILLVTCTLAGGAAGLWVGHFLKHRGGASSSLHEEHRTSGLTLWAMAIGATCLAATIAAGTSQLLADTASDTVHVAWIVLVGGVGTFTAVWGRWPAWRWLVNAKATLLLAGIALLLLAIHAHSDSGLLSCLRTQWEYRRSSIAETTSGLQCLWAISLGAVVSLLLAINLPLPSRGSQWRGVASFCAGALVSSAIVSALGAALDGLYQQQPHRMRPEWVAIYRTIDGKQVTVDPNSEEPITGDPPQQEADPRAHQRYIERISRRDAVTGAIEIQRRYDEMLTHFLAGSFYPGLLGIVLAGIVLVAISGFNGLILVGTADDAPTWHVAVRGIVAILLAAALLFR